MNAPRIARLTVTLDDVKPRVRRLVDVPLFIRLDRLHLVLQAALGWTNTHLYEIRACGMDWGVPDPDWEDGTFDARKICLADVLEGTGVKVLRYVYDFGDSWKHRVVVGRVRDAVPGFIYPRLIEASGRCPPENVGGPRGYAAFLDAVSDPGHEEHARQVSWAGGHFDPNVVDAHVLTAHVALLARKWARKPPVRRMSIS